MIRFPSVLWFEEMRALANSDPEHLRRLGTVDLALVVKIDSADRSSLFEIAFSGYRCTQVRELADLAAAAPDAVVIEGPYQTWREMVENIRAHGHADLNHTLNTLTIYDTPMRVTARNQLDTDLFYRYQQNLQEFFDNAAKVPTYFAESEQAHAA
ncbi:MAG TPA: hypothetical protein VMU16_11215 [Candidatus Binataceae bacterium]|nr:hypothetical protein [Candidatus Binataceae bacterium]